MPLKVVASNVPIFTLIGSLEVKRTIDICGSLALKVMVAKVKASLSKVSAADVKAAPPGAPNVAAGPAAPAIPPPAVAPVPPPQTYRYNPAGKTDPFMPFVEIDLAVKKEKEKKAREEELKKQAVGMKRPISPLQQAEIGQFRLVGIAEVDGLDF